MLGQEPFRQIEKVTPHNLEAEQAVLAAMLMDVDAVYTALEQVVADDFYKGAHRIIFESICDLFNQGEPIDLVTLGNALLKKNALDKVGGHAYLAQVMNSIPTAANIVHHAQIVKEKAILRNLINTSTQIIADCYENDDVSALLDRAEGRMFEIAQKRESKSIVSIKDQIFETFNTIESMYQNAGAVAGLSTGFSDVDSICSGLKKSELIILAARPSMGKTAFAQAIMEHVAMEQGKSALFFSLEMSKESLVQRMLCSYARVSSHELMRGYMGEDGWVRLTNAASKLSKADIYIDDTPGMSVLEMKTKARRLKARGKLDLIVVDYLQLMTSYKKSDNRQNEISDISRSLKELARETDVPVIALSQLSRAVESRTDKRPMLSDLRESGAIEQDADLVIMLMREEYYNPTEENKNKAEVIIGKNRNGPTGNTEIAFIKEYTRFENLTYRQEPN